MEEHGGSSAGRDIQGVVSAALNSINPIDKTAINGRAMISSLPNDIL
jgi:hypothetical protein